MGIVKEVTKTYFKTTTKTFKMTALVTGIFALGREVGRKMERGTNTTYDTPIGTFDVSLGADEKLRPLEIVYQWCGNKAVHPAHDTHKGKTVYHHDLAHYKVTAPLQYRCPGVDKSGIRRIKKEQ